MTCRFRKVEENVTNRLRLCFSAGVTDWKKVKRRTQRSAPTAICQMKLLIDGTIGLASPIVGTLLVHAEGVPGGGTEYQFVVHVVHTYRYAQHGCQCDEVGSYMSVADGTVVGSPVVHH